MRLSESAAPELIQTAYAREVADTAILYEGMSFADMAHVVMLIEVGVIPRPAGGQLLHALLKTHPKPPIDYARDPAVGDIYSNREAYLAMLTLHAGYLSTGRARREAITIAYRIAARSRLLKLAAVLTDCAHAAADLAETHIATLFPDYTYLQTAQPTTFGHYLLTFVYPILRDLDRLQAAFSRTNVSPAGCGSVNGSRLPLDRENTATLLGFDTLIPHALDRLAEDLQIFATQEFGLVRLADRHSRTSKIMPQKKNPYSLTYVRGVAGETIGTLAAMAAIGKTPSGQPDNRLFAHGDVPRALDQAIGATELMAGVLRGLTINVERASERAMVAFAGTTDLAEVIMLEAKLDFRTAHDIVSRVVRDVLESEAESSAISPEMIAVAAEAVIERRIELPAERLTEVLNPASIIATRTGPGGAAESSIAAMLAEIRAALGRYTQWRQALEFRLAEAETTLLAKARSLALSPKPPSDSKGKGEKTMGDVLGELPERNWRRRRW
jgi:argininosuccinate lyase